MKTVLSTKILLPAQKEFLTRSGLEVVEYDALEIAFLEAQIPLDHQNYIFTSQNAVKAFLQQTRGVNCANYYAFCVGEKTKTFLEENGIKVLKMAQKAADLARFIAKNKKKEIFVFVCGNLRREELPRILVKKNILYKEVEVYETLLVSKKFHQSFEGILFFSPSGIQSYTTENSLGNSWAFCIGDTTAREARKYTHKIVTPNKPTVENVLARVVKKMEALD